MTASRVDERISDLAPVADRWKTGRDFRKELVSLSAGEVVSLLSDIVGKIGVSERTKLELSREIYAEKRGKLSNLQIELSNLQRNGNVREIKCSG